MHGRLTLSSALVMLLAIMFSSELQAQPKNRSLCLRDSGPGCRTYLVTETGILHSLSEKPFDAHLNVEVGVLHKINDRWAYGGSLDMIYDEDGRQAFLLAAKPRVRYRFNDRIHSDLAAGVIFAQISEDYEYLRLPMVTGSLSVGWRDYVSVILQLEALRFKYFEDYGPPFEPNPPQRHEMDTKFYLGVSFGSIPGAIMVPLATAACILVEYGDDHWD